MSLIGLEALSFLQEGQDPCQRLEPWDDAYFPQKAARTRFETPDPPWAPMSHRGDVALLNYDGLGLLCWRGALRRVNRMEIEAAIQRTEKDCLSRSSRPLVVHALSDIGETADPQRRTSCAPMWRMMTEPLTTRLLSLAVCQLHGEIESAENFQTIWVAPVASSTLSVAT